MKHLVLQGNSSSSSQSSMNEELLSRTGYTILAVIMGVFSVGGIILNVLVIVVTVKHRQLRQPLSYALVNLAICDLGCAVFGGLPTTVNSAMGYFSLGRVGCILGGFAVAFFGESNMEQRSRFTCNHFYSGGGRSQIFCSQVTKWTLKHTFLL